MLVPLVLFVFWIGLYPKPVLDVMHASVDRLLQNGPVVMTVENHRPPDGLPVMSSSKGIRISQSGRISNQ